MAKVLNCAYCNGTGRTPSRVFSCGICKGKGKISIEKDMVRCGACRGTGRHPQSKLTCLNCKGTGFVKSSKSNVLEKSSNDSFPFRVKKNVFIPKIGD